MEKSTEPRRRLGVHQGAMPHVDSHVLPALLRLGNSICNTNQTCHYEDFLTKSPIRYRFKNVLLRLKFQVL